VLHRPELALQPVDRRLQLLDRGLRIRAQLEARLPLLPRLRLQSFLDLVDLSRRLRLRLLCLSQAGRERLVRFAHRFALLHTDSDDN